MRQCVLSMIPASVLALASFAVPAPALAQSPAQTVAPQRAVSPAPTPPPRLIVAIAVDQFSADLFVQYRRHFSGGLARLLSGAVFPSAYQSHAATETCPGPATILAGVHPASGARVCRGSSNRRRCRWWTSRLHWRRCWG